MKRLPLAARVLVGGALVVSGCAFGGGALRARASTDLSCPAEQLETRCVASARSEWVVTGCGRYAQYTKTTNGPMLQHIGDGRPPNESRLCASVDRF